MKRLCTLITYDSLKGFNQRPHIMLYSMIIIELTFTGVLKIIQLLM
jgi:hypothetical protein